MILSILLNLSILFLSTSFCTVTMDEIEYEYEFFSGIFTRCSSAL